MPSFHEEEVLRSGTAGKFMPHSLILNIESLADLSPEGGCSEDELVVQRVLALHVHEYIHYLHNLTTRSGLSRLTDVFLLVQPLLKQKMNDEGGREISSAQKKHVRMVFDSIYKSKGYEEGIPDDYNWRTVKNWKYSQLTGTNPVVPEALMDPEQEIIFSVTATFFDGSEFRFRLVPGFDFITEGIAYEVERNIRMRAGSSGLSVDNDTPAFPYLAYGPLIEHLAGGVVASEERVVIGTMALLASSPSVALTSLSKLHSHKEGTLGAVAFTAIVDDILEKFALYSDYFRESIIPMFYQIFSRSEILTKGMEVYEKLITKGLDSRRERKCFELVFLRENIQLGSFNNIAATLLERVVFQGKPNSFTEIRWEGSDDSLVAMSHMHEAFAVLQACIHYVQRHLTTGGLETKASLDPTRCPFSGACTIEQAAGHPDICKARPWDAKNVGGNSTLCTYEAGVDAFRSLIGVQAVEGYGDLPF